MKSFLKVPFSNKFIYNEQVFDEPENFLNKDEEYLTLKYEPKFFEYNNIRYLSLEDPDSAKRYLNFALSETKSFVAANKICNVPISLWEKTFPKEIQNKILQLQKELLEKNKIRKDNAFQLEIIQKVVGELSKYKIKFDNKVLFFKKNISKKNFVQYNFIENITGRLSTKHGSFPILNFPKKDRDAIVPNKDYFVSLDYTSAELKTAFILCGHQEFDDDLLAKFQRNEDSREDLKKNVYGWLFSDKENEFYNSILNKRELYKKYFKNNEVVNPFNRKIPCDRFHAINYLVQSTLADIVYEQSFNVLKYMKNEKMESLFAFLIHDNAIFDVINYEQEKIKQIISIFEDTRFEKFKVKVYSGKNLRDLEQETK